MRCFRIVLPLLVLLFVAGCVPALHSFYTPDDVVYEEALLGRWQQENGSSVWTFSPLPKEKQKANLRQYRVLIDLKEKDKTKRAVMVGTLLRLKGTVYLDLAPGTPEELKEKVSAFWAWHVLAAHTLWRMDREQKTLHLRPMNPRRVEDYLQQHPGEVAHTTLDGRLVLTAPTQQLQAFVNKHQKEIFDGKGMVLKRAESK